MPSFSDSIFLFVLALLLFGPKRLPVLARELGKWVGEFRRASNEFKMQMEEELRLSEQADRQKQIAAMEAAAPITPPLESPEHPHLPQPESASAETATSTETGEAALDYGVYDDYGYAEPITASAAELSPTPAPELASAAETASSPSVLPIATSGDLHLMPPSTGLPTPRSASRANGNPLDGLLEAIPESPTSNEAAQAATPEIAAHGH